MGGDARIRSCEKSTRCGVFEQGLVDSGGRVMIYEGEQAPSDCSVWEFGFRFGNHMSVGRTSSPFKAMSGLAMLTQRFEVWSSVANVSMEVYSIADAAVEDLTHDFT